MRFASITMLICFVFLANNVAVMPKPPNPCTHKSATAPEPLRGSLGNSASDHFWFSHLSDVDKLTDKNYFVYSIENKHPILHLPVQWEQAQIRFDRVVPGGCAANDFETSFSYKEDPKSILKYGPTKQHKKDAPLFLRDDKKAIGSKARPALKSRIVAKLLDEEGSAQSVHLDFVTTVEGHTFQYTVSNMATILDHAVDQRFAIPKLSKHWEKARTQFTVNEKDHWTKDDRGAFLSRVERRDERQVFNVTDLKDIDEKQFEVQIMSKAGKEIGAGQAIFYVPRLKE